MAAFSTFLIFYPQNVFFNGLKSFKKEELSKRFKIDFKEGKMKVFLYLLKTMPAKNTSMIANIEIKWLCCKKMVW